MRMQLFKGLGGNMLYDKLIHYKTGDYYPFHMPGHKRNSRMQMENPYAIDITEIEGFDNLHHPQGILKEEMERASVLYGSDKSYFLVNGSTCGILSAISGVTEYGDSVIVARNCHKSVYHAIELRGLKAAYVYPDVIPEFGIQGGVRVEEVEAVIREHPQAKAVMITSPTYEGIVSDVGGIAQAAHKAGMILIVDEAHGAHFSRHSAFPKSALDNGADIVIQSLHKTLPALTQTAILHIKSKLVDEKRIEKYLQTYQTSSPSYVLMASIDKCMRWLEERSPQEFSEYVELLKMLWRGIGKFSHLHFFDKHLIGYYGIFDIDPSKLVISVHDTGYTGKKLYDELLGKFHLQMEMAAEDYVIAMTSVMDTYQGVERLLAALEQIDRHIRLYVKDDATEMPKLDDFEKAIVYSSISETSRMEQEKVIFIQSAGRISGEYVYVYPPGIPILAPGEMITKDIIRRCECYQRLGLPVMGAEDETLKGIRVLKEQWTSLQPEMVQIANVSRE